MALSEAVLAEARANPWPFAKGHGHLHGVYIKLLLRRLCCSSLEERLGLAKGYLYVNAAIQHDPRHNPRCGGGPNLQNRPPKLGAASGIGASCRKLHLRPSSGRVRRRLGKSEV